MHKGVGSGADIYLIIYRSLYMRYLRLNYKKKDESNVNNAPVRLVFTTE